MANEDVVDSKMLRVVTKMKEDGNGMRLSGLRLIEVNAGEKSIISVNNDGPPLSTYLNKLTTINFYVTDNELKERMDKIMTKETIEISGECEKM